MLQNPAKEQKSSIRKDSEVEVSSEDDGFKGAWYRAILEDNPTKSGRKKLQVRYTTLLREDFSTLLTEKVEQRFIRPVPPEDMNEQVEFEEGSVVDADHKDGWWTGLILREMEDEKKFLVYFDSPPDIIQFERKQLRAHLDWIDSKWVRPENKELSKSLFSSGTIVELSCKNDNLETVWIPSLIVNEIEEDGEKKFIVKCYNESLSCNGDELKPNKIVDTCDVRPIPPPFFVEEYKLLDRVDAFHGSGWHQSLVRGILSEKRYRVSFLATNEELVFKHSDLRPSKDWEDGVWHQGPKRKPVKGTPKGRKRNMSVASETKLSETTALCRPKKLKIIRSSTAAKPITPSSLSVATPQVIPIEKESGPSVTEVIDATPVKEQETETNGMASPETSVADVVNEEDRVVVMPFVKRSPIWKVFESMDVFKTVKQIPHFIPLLEIREEFREGSAVGEMVNFSTLLERVRNLQLDVPKTTLEGLKYCFSELDKYGFHVTPPISRINMLLSLKDKQVNQVEELKYKKKEMTEEVIKNQRFEEDLREVERKIIELRSQETDLKEKKDASDKEIAQMQLCAADLDKKIQDVELEFQSVVSAPW